MARDGGPRPSARARRYRAARCIGAAATGGAARGADCIGRCAAWRIACRPVAGDRLGARAARQAASRGVERMEGGACRTPLAPTGRVRQQKRRGMNWFGIVVLGFAVGLLGWALNPLRRLSRASLWLAAAAGVLGAAAAKMAGNVAGLFYDGETLEWPVCTAAALLAVAVTVGLSARR
ncbi:hypothetical protein BMAA0506 [Burkholderia mallei ATCC 23344]|nr:hypothetical protein BMAA0506 [Burkholderia mallei ATCC 23344]